MNRKIGRAWGLLAMGLLSAPALAAEPARGPWGTIVVGTQTEAERLATIDLQRYLGQVSGTVPAVVSVADWRRHPGPAVVLGTVAGNALIGQADGPWSSLGDEGYELASVTLAGTPVVRAAGRTPAGAVCAVYGLLRELGFGFFLGSESVPDRLPPGLPTAAPVVRRPVFAIRGVLPWYNFFDSPTTWDPIDHRAVVDQLIRSGANFIGFHSYDSEPFAAYEENGSMKMGARLLNTKSPTWGTHPMPAEQYAFGTDRLFADESFGAETTQHGTDPGEAIKAEQDVLRDAFDYARRRGVHTCVGFEVSGDPTNPATRDVVARRINHLLDQYPAIDYLWIWQSEAQGGPGYGEERLLADPFKPGSSLEQYTLARRETFHRIADSPLERGDYLRKDPASRAARAREGARLEQFARLAHRLIGHRRNPPKLVVSGWGGDEYLCSEEYYDGLDKVLPSDVVFSSLDLIRPHPRVDAVYGELPPTRQRWPIPWLECDGDQWHPQPNVHIYEGVAADAHRKGCQGILGIHWRTRDVEENLAYLVDYAWQPGLTAEAFFDQFARRCYGPGIAAEMARVHSQLDAMGWRWVGGQGQTECGEFDFDPGTPARIDELSAVRARVALLLPRAGSSAARVRWLLARIDWTLQYSRAEIAAVEARKLLGAKKPAEALAVLDAGDLPTSLRTYATRVTTRGEHGVLATINTKAVYAWRELREQCLTALGRPSQPLPAPVWNPEPQVVLPRLVASAPAFRSLELLPVALGGKPVWLHYRGLGGPAWKTLPAREVRGWVRRATIPAADMVGPGVEYAFSFDPSPDASPAWGPACVTVMPPSLVDTMPRPRIEAGSSPTLALSCSCTGGFPFLLQWNERPDSDFYKVYRDGQLVTETCVAFYPDAPVTPAPGHGYLVEAWRDGRVLAAADVTARSPDVESRETVVPAVRWKKTGAILQWPKLATLHVACFRVLRSAPGAPGQFKPVSEIPSVRLGMNRLPVEPERGRNTYRIVPVNQAGKEGKPVDIVLHWPNNELVEVVLDDLVREARVVGQVAVAGDAARFTGEGHLELPHDEALNLEQGGAIRLEFRADRTDGMPVLLSHGQYQADGWFLQILGRRLILRTTSADLDGPEIVPGRWYALRAEFDGTRASLLVDGKAIAADREMRVTPCKRPLRIGQYDVPGASYAFRGAIRNLKVTSWVQRSDAAVHFDFAGGDLWPLRDGKVKVGTTVVDGRPTIRLEIGDGASRFNSAWIHPERIDLDLASVLRFRVRTTSTEPLALLLQQEKDTDVWRAINLVGRQSAYPSLADLTAQKLNDGQWHEVSLDLRPLIASRLEPGKKPRIKNLIVGSWEQPLRPIVVEFQSFEVTKATE